MYCVDYKTRIDEYIVSRWVIIMTLKVRVIREVHSSICISNCYTSTHTPTCEVSLRSYCQLFLVVSSNGYRRKWSGEEEERKKAK